MLSGRLLYLFWLIMMKIIVNMAILKQLPLDVADYDDPIVNMDLLKQVPLGVADYE